jgi:hypothetical protein
MIRSYFELTKDISQKRRDAIEHRKAQIRQKIAALVVNKTKTPANLNPSL